MKGKARKVNKKFLCVGKFLIKANFGGKYRVAQLRVSLGEYFIRTFAGVVPLVLRFD